jgi:hypothetical protein
MAMPRLSVVNMRLMILKVFNEMKKLSITKGQSSLKKTIIWIKRNKMGKQEWAKACKDVNFHFQKLKILVKRVKTQSKEPPKQVDTP